MFNCGLLAIELEAADIDALFRLGKGVAIQVDIDKGIIMARNGQEKTLSFTLNPFDAELVKAGGWLTYANDKY
jgi:3-isopropylmalate/(R)-2-methylmalate dehydratase small subunit